jgi:hypothetical protein
MNGGHDWWKCASIGVEFWDAIRILISNLILITQVNPKFFIWVLSFFKF